MEEQHTKPAEHARTLIKNFRTAMLSTVADDGGLRSRPMAMQAVEFEGTLWFFAADDSEMVRDITRDPHVGLTLASDRDDTYVALSGRAHITRDRIRIRELWNPSYEPWFPLGVDDPRLVLVKIDIEGGEYWDSAAARPVPFSELVKSALASGSPADDAPEHATFRT